MLFVFVVLIVVVNGIFGGVFGLFGLKGVILEFIFGYVFFLIVFLIGVLWYEVLQVGSYIGQKLVLNEFVVYFNFGLYIGEFFKKIVIIISFVLCGFVNFLLIVIMFGMFGGLVFSCCLDIVCFGLKVVFVGILVNLFSVVIVGMFI